MKSIDSKEYEKRFRAILKKLSARSLYKELTATYGPDVTLLCYEKPTDFCHRHIVASWFEDEVGVKIPELKF
jgi:uncharacterized protein YeaO (DUF488 family)